MNILDISSPLLREIDIENEFRMKSYQNMVFEESDVSESDNESAITDCCRRNDDLDYYSSDDDEDDEEDRFYRQCICTDKDCEMRKRCDDDLDTVLFRKQSDILDTMRYVYALPNACNVTFIVGPLKQTVQGVKTVVGSGSRHLSKLIEGSVLKKRSKKAACEHYTVIITNYEYRTFKSLVCFLHSGQIRINLSNVVGLLCAAHEYGIRDLLAACWDFVDDVFLKGKTKELRMQCEIYRERSPVQCIINLEAFLYIDLVTQLASTSNCLFLNVISDAMHSTSRCGVVEDMCISECSTPSCPHMGNGDRVTVSCENTF